MMTCGFDAGVLRYSGTAVDVWSLGVMLYIMVAGKAPFRGKTHNDMLRSILKAKFIMPEDLSPELQSLLTSMLEPNPKQRASIRVVSCHPWVVAGADAHRPLTVHQTGSAAGGGGGGDKKWDEQAVEDVVGFGFDRQTVEAALLAKKRNSITSAYRLAVQQRWLASQRSGVLA